MPNVFAYFVLLSWPLVTLMLFRTLPLANAIAISIIGGYLIIPQQTGFDFPILPTFDKNSIPVLSSTLMCLIIRRFDSKNRHNILIEEQISKNPHKSKKNISPYIFLIALLIGATFATVATNSDPLILGTTYLPAMRIYDAFSFILRELIFILPFILGFKYLTSESEHRILLNILVMSGLFYSFLALFEVRMSPQLNLWIYGFFPHSFLQHIRGGGYRPIVFLQHGLWVSIFFATTVLAAVTLLKSKSNNQSHTWTIVAAFWLFFTLFLTKSLGAFILTLLFAPVIWFMRIRGHMLVAVFMSGVVLLYPMFRGADLVPVQEISDFAESINPERAASFKTRIENEDRLLARANERPLVGWGGWGRSEVYEQETGFNISITDGAWIIFMGIFGWLGYIARFGLLTFPIFMLAISGKRKNITLVTSGLCLILAANLIDLLPNSTLTPLTWLIAGALAGYSNKAGPNSEIIFDTDDQSSKHIHIRERR